MTRIRLAMGTIETPTAPSPSTSRCHWAKKLEYQPPLACPTTESPYLSVSFTVREAINPDGGRAY